MRHRDWRLCLPTEGRTPIAGSQKSGSAQVAAKSLHQISDHLWGFSITFGGFIANGFTYNAISRQIKMPTCRCWGEKGAKKVVRVAGGIHIKRLREKVEEAIGNRDESDWES